ncbi:MAG: ArsR/SmtB family transcription factor [Phycisphaerales bacterium JB043]
MVEHSGQLDLIFGALADPTRRRILGMVAQAERRVSEIAEPFAMSLAAVSKHLRVLERAGLVTRRKAGRVHHMRANPDAMASAREWIEVYSRGWEEGFDALARYLDSPDAPARERDIKTTNRKGGT